MTDIQRPNLKSAQGSHPVNIQLYMTYLVYTLRKHSLIRSFVSITVLHFYLKYLFYDDHTQNYAFCSLQLVVETFGNST